MTKFAIASCRSFLGRILSEGTPLLLPCVLVAGALLGSSTGCKSKSSASADGGDGSSQANCPPNPNNASGSAATLTSGQSVTNKVCYQGSQSWYTINVPSGNTLLDVSAGYGATSNSPVELDVKVYFKSSATTLTPVNDLLAGGSDAGTNGIKTTVHAVQSGTYYLEVHDNKDTNVDGTNSYTLTAGYAADPDTHEPNDTIATAKPSDTKPGYLAYLGDLDIFDTTVMAAGDLLSLTINNPTTAPAAVEYSITSSTGTVLATGSAKQAAAASSTYLSAAASGTYYVTLSYPVGTTPSRSASGAYTVSFSSVPNPDTVNNHSYATAVCPGGGGGSSACSMPFTGGTTVSLPAVTSFITVPGQRDYYRVDVTGGAALVLQAKLTSASSTSVKYAVDLLASDPSTPCQVDTDCARMNQPCATADDCELSHACLLQEVCTVASGGNGDASYCSFCQGSSSCIPTGAGPGGGHCAVAQYLSAYTPSGRLSGASSVSTAQPLFTNGTYFISVHDVGYANTDLTNPYTLTLTMAPEPDPNDSSSEACSRNNFYDPYPNATSDESPNMPRAIDITAQVAAGTPVTGYISYQGDNDWYSFEHPCPGENCALEVNWTQPGPSPVDVAFFILTSDYTQHPATLTITESFAYTAGSTLALSGPTTGTLNSQSCGQCSVALATAKGDGGSVDAGGCSQAVSGYHYFVRVADVTQTNWDYTPGPGAQYSFTIQKGATGCPPECNYGPNGCGCYCLDGGKCPGAQL